MQLFMLVIQQHHQCHAFPAPIGNKDFLGNQMNEFSNLSGSTVQQLHDVSLSNISRFIATKEVGEVLLPKQLHSYSKVLEFTKLQEALDNLMLNILNIDPDKKFHKLECLLEPVVKNIF